VTLSISTAKKLLRLMHGERLPSSSLKDVVVQKMIEDGVIQKVQSNSKAVLLVAHTDAFAAYLRNQFGIHDLGTYVEKYAAPGLTRSEAIQLAADSKLRSIRTFTGFLVNSYSDVPCSMKGEPFLISQQNGACTFISDYHSFVPAEHVTIVGIENAENFFRIQQQQYLFEGILPLFVSRYPQGNDLVKWLASISNPYLHFGDLDFEGVSIYLREYKRHLLERATFFIPPGVDVQLTAFGNRELYNKQLDRATNLPSVTEPAIDQLINLFHTHKKVLEQEVFIKREPFDHT
jgi:hypothetical protein